MGNSHSQELHKIVQIKQPNTWVKVEDKGNYEIWQNKHDRFFYDAYSIQQDLTKDENQLEKYNFRKNNGKYLVLTQMILNEQQTFLCSSPQSSYVLLEHILCRLSSYQNGLTFPEGLYVLSCATSGYNLLNSFYGPLQTNEQMICINSQGRVKVWLNEYLIKNEPSISTNNIRLAPGQGQNNNRNNQENNNNGITFAERRSHQCTQKLFATVQRAVHNGYPPEFKQQTNNIQTYFEAFNFIESYCEQHRIRMADHIGQREYQSQNISSTIGNGRNIVEISRNQEFQGGNLGHSRVKETFSPQHNNTSFLPNHNLKNVNFIPQSFKTLTPPKAKQNDSFLYRSTKLPPMSTTTNNPLQFPYIPSHPPNFLLQKHHSPDSMKVMSPILYSSSHNRNTATIVQPLQPLNTSNHVTFAPLPSPKSTLNNSIQQNPTHNLNQTQHDLKHYHIVNRQERQNDGKGQKLHEKWNRMIVNLEEKRSISNVRETQLRNQLNEVFNTNHNPTQQQQRSTEIKENVGHHNHMHSSDQPQYHQHQHNKLHQTEAMHQVEGAHHHYQAEHQLVEHQPHLRYSHEDEAVEQHHSEMEGSHQYSEIYPYQIKQTHHQQHQQYQQEYQQEQGEQQKEQQEQEPEHEYYQSSSQEQVLHQQNHLSHHHDRIESFEAEPSEIQKWEQKLMQMSSKVIPHKPEHSQNKAVSPATTNEQTHPNNHTTAINKSTSYHQQQQQPQEQPQEQQEQEVNEMNAHQVDDMQSYIRNKYKNYLQAEQPTTKQIKNKSYEHSTNSYQVEPQTDTYHNYSKASHNYTAYEDHGYALDEDNEVRYATYENYKPFTHNNAFDYSKKDTVPTYQYRTSIPATYQYSSIQEPNTNYRSNSYNIDENNYRPSYQDTYQPQPTRSNRTRKPSKRVSNASNASSNIEEKYKKYVLNNAHSNKSIKNDHQSIKNYKQAIQYDQKSQKSKPSKVVTPHKDISIILHQTSKNNNTDRLQSEESDRGYIHENNSNNYNSKYKTTKMDDTKQEDKRRQWLENKSLVENNNSRRMESKRVTYDDLRLMLRDN